MMPIFNFIIRLGYLYIFTLSNDRQISLFKRPGSKIIRLCGSFDLSQNYPTLL